MVVKASITKADIAKCARHYGKRNKTKFQDAAAGEVMYISFVGALNLESGLYEGEHRFCPAGKAETELIDFHKEIPQCQ